LATMNHFLIRWRRGDKQAAGFMKGDRGCGRANQADKWILSQRPLL